jgi:hypothetical protein
MGHRLRYALLIALGIVWPNGGWSDTRPDAVPRHAAAVRAVLEPVAPPPADARHPRPSRAVAPAERHGAPPAPTG